MKMVWIDFDEEHRRLYETRSIGGKWCCLMDRQEVLEFEPVPGGKPCAVAAEEVRVIQRMPSMKGVYGVQTEGGGFWTCGYLLRREYTPEERAVVRVLGGAVQEEKQAGPVAPAGDSIECGAVNDAPFTVEGWPKIDGAYRLVKWACRDAHPGRPPHRVFLLWLAGTRNVFIQAEISAGNFTEITERPRGIALFVKPNDPRLYCPWVPSLGPEKKANPAHLVIGERPAHTEDYLFTDGYTLRIHELSEQDWDGLAPASSTPQETELSEAEKKQKAKGGHAKAQIHDKNKRATWNYFKRLSKGSKKSWRLQETANWCNANREQRFPDNKPRVTPRGVLRVVDEYSRKKDNN